MIHVTIKSVKCNMWKIKYKYLDICFNHSLLKNNSFSLSFKNLHIFFQIEHFKYLFSRNVSIWRTLNSPGMAVKFATFKMVNPILAEAYKPAVRQMTVMQLCIPLQASLTKYRSNSLPAVQTESYYCIHRHHLLAAKHTCNKVCL